jgi:hypothetical protein
MGCGRDDECRNEKSNESQAREALDHKECAPLKNVKQRICEKTPQDGFYGGDRPQGNALERRGFSTHNDRGRADWLRKDPFGTRDLAPIASDNAGWRAKTSRAENCRAHFLYQLLLAGIRMN